jgi:hypothetical protein
MRSFARLRSLVLTLGVSALTATTATPAAAALTPHAYMPQAPTYSFTDADGRFDNQINYFAGPRTQWSYRVSAPLVAAATGTATEVATLSRDGKLIPGYRDLHSGVSPRYLFHSAYGPLQTTHNYLLHIVIRFRVSGGYAILTFDHAFYITLV